jgi:hypothetical protein
VYNTQAITELHAVLSASSHTATWMRGVVKAEWSVASSKP